MWQRPAKKDYKQYAEVHRNEALEKSSFFLRFAVLLFTRYHSPWSSYCLPATRRHLSGNMMITMDHHQISGKHDHSHWRARPLNHKLLLSAKEIIVLRFRRFQPECFDVLLKIR